MRLPPIPTTLPVIRSKVAERIQRDAEEHPTWADVQNRWGLLLLANGKHAEARAAFARSLEINPRYGWAVLNHIQALALEGEIETARRLLADAPEPAPGARCAVQGFLDLCHPQSASGDPLAGLAPELLARPDFQRLHAALHREDHSSLDLLLFVPGLHQLFRQAAIWEVRLGNRDRAEELTASMLAVWHDLGAYWCQQGFIASLQGDETDSVGAYEEAARNSPQSPEPLIALAYHWSAQAEAERAHDVLTRALRIAPRFADLHYQMGLLKMYRGELEVALASFRSALALNPNYTVARLQEAETLTALELWNEAREAYSRVVDAGLQSTDVFLQVGQIEERLARPIQAEEAYRTALRLSPGEPLGHYHLGRLYRDRGERAKARRAWRQYVALTGESGATDEIRAVLDEGDEAEG